MVIKNKPVSTSFYSSSICFLDGMFLLVQGDPHKAYSLCKPYINLFSGLVMNRLFRSLVKRSEIKLFQKYDTACRTEILICRAAYNLSGNNIQLHSANEMYYHYVDEKIKYFFFFHSQNIVKGWFSAWKDILLKLCAEPTTHWLNKMKTNEKRNLYETTSWRKKIESEIGMFILTVYYISFVFSLNLVVLDLMLFREVSFYRDLSEYWQQWCKFLVVP